MELTIQIVKRNANGKVVSEQKVDTQAVLTDKANKVVEVLETNAVNLEAVFWNRKDGVFQVHYSLGAKDSTGAYHANPEYKILTEIWGRLRTPAIWEKYDLNNLNALDLEAVKEWLYDEHVIKFAIRDKWQIPGADYKLLDAAGAVVKDYPITLKPKAAPVEEVITAP